MDKDKILEALQRYPPKEVCDEWYKCIDEADRTMRDLYCENCDTYWDCVAAYSEER